MANSNINVNYTTVRSVITQLINDIGTAENDVELIYNSIESDFSDSKGDMAEAIRDQKEAEKELMAALQDLLGEFANSVSFAAGQVHALDRKMARGMHMH